MKYPDELVERVAKALSEAVYPMGGTRDDHYRLVALTALDAIGFREVTATGELIGKYVHYGYFVGRGTKYRHLVAQTDWEVAE